MREAIPGPFPVGALVYVADERRPYRVRASNRRFAVCTKPFNLQHTTLYCILDFERLIRGPEDLIFGMGAESDQHCEQMLARLSSGDTAVSRRRSVEWDVVRVTDKKTEDRP